MVIWSAEAVKSQWVRAEANVAREAGTLVQVRVDETTPPLPFNEIQCVDLIGWSGDATRRAGGRWRRASPRWPAARRRPSPPPRAGQGAGAAAGQLSVCVLPFENMSGDPEQEYFSDGISEDIITDLSKVSALDVCARNTAFTFKGKSVRVPEVARELGVSHVLEGSVRKAGARVRITAQLIDGATGNHVWADRYDRDLTDIFALQDEISEAIVERAAAQAAAGREERHRAARDGKPEAYEIYLMGRQIVDDRRCERRAARRRSSGWRSGRSRSIPTMRRPGR